MKNRLFHFIILILTGGACALPDVTTQNPPRLLDSPAFNVTPSGDSQGTANGKLGYDGKTIGTTYIIYGSTVNFGIDVVDCPGKVAGVTSSISVPTYSTVTVDAASLVGQETGSAKVTVQAMAAPDATDRSANLTFSVTDNQTSTDGNAPKTTTVTWPVVFIKGCVSTMAAGTYKVTAASGVLDGGTPYTLASLEANSHGGAGGPITFDITQNRPGFYTIGEGTGGVWTTFYPTRAIPALGADLCGTTVSGRPGFLTTGAGTTSTRVFVINGTVNGDKTVTVTWSYTRTQGTPTNPANGTYTLTKI
jgi:hypothetical protein